MSLQRNIAENQAILQAPLTASEINAMLTNPQSPLFKEYQAALEMAVLQYRLEIKQLEHFIQAQQAQCQLEDKQHELKTIRAQIELDELNRKVAEYHRLISQREIAAINMTITPSTSEVFNKLVDQLISWQATETQLAQVQEEQKQLAGEWRDQRAEYSQRVMSALTGTGVSIAGTQFALGADSEEAQTIQTRLAERQPPAQVLSRLPADHPMREAFDNRVNTLREQYLQQGHSGCQAEIQARKHAREEFHRIDHTMNLDLIVAVKNLYDGLINQPGFREALDRAYEQKIGRERYQREEESGICYDVYGLLNKAVCRVIGLDTLRQQLQDQDDRCIENCVAQKQLTEQHADQQKAAQETLSELEKMVAGSTEMNEFLKRIRDKFPQTNECASSLRCGA